MALLTTRQKQDLILPVLVFLLVGGFIGSLWQGNPVSITILIILVLAVCTAIFLRVRRRRRIAAAKAERVRQAESQYAEHLAEVKRRSRELAPSKPRTVNFQILVMSDDTLESLTVRVMEQYAERGGTIPVAEAKAMAAKALAEQSR
jgi:hypothetical protein